MDKVNFFDSMTNEQKDAIAGSLISQKYDKNKEIVNKGDEANSYYIIKKVLIESYTREPSHVLMIQERR